MGARYYDPTLACFLTRDTVLGQKPYTYCDGDPVNHNDASGHLVVNLILPGFSMSIGPLHIETSIGFAVQLPGFGASSFGYEFYNSSNAGIGIGLGASVTPGFGGAGIGIGNLNGFNGTSAFAGLYAQPFTNISYSQSLTGGYQGIQVGTPHAGLEFGAYGGLGYTKRLFGGWGDR